LKNLENEILTAREKSIAMESEILGELREKIAGAVERIQGTANAIASLDLMCSFAHLAKENNYVRPTITKTGEIVIEDGRHPVVEQLLNMRGFVPNDLLMDKNENRIAIITGPNMAGKSTYIRQTAIIVLMAQLGSFVPAKSARIGVVDGIYTRVGASDDLATGQSTFMVEMNEVANILKNATGNSLLILDEVGRGTSTFDGMSIARATLEYIADVKKLGAKTLFATHYHELTDMEYSFSCIKNYNTAVKKRGENITFLRRIVKGAVDDSYGIEVSKLAGIPDWIIKRAHEILLELEKGKGEGHFEHEALQQEEQQLSLVQKSKVEDALQATDLNTLTPIEALSMLFKLKDMIN
ncbi:MAG: DNA mismatch repair protein MutS, partial [Oscillospiraceae bacterium]